MSTERTPEIEYRCFNDCIEAGCPGHVLRLDLHHTSNTLSTFQDGERGKTFDYNELEAIIQSYGLWKKRARIT